jgi:hypothetical protein
MSNSSPLAEDGRTGSTGRGRAVELVDVVTRLRDEPDRCPPVPDGFTHYQGGCRSLEERSCRQGNSAEQ